MVQRGHLIGHTGPSGLPMRCSYLVVVVSDIGCPSEAGEQLASCDRRTVSKSITAGTGRQRHRDEMNDGQDGRARLPKAKPPMCWLLVAPSLATAVYPGNKPMGLTRPRHQ